ncbi:MAG: SWIM zinc finger family protein [Gemmataceae bacterium]|nr:SWIM zinc finger family protein [Gemmataceae bacterium]
MWFQFRPYVPVAKRKAQAAREVEKRRKKGQTISPVVIEGRTIAKTFWGKAWCDNLESYSDYENRLPRGRTYVRNGSVVDLQIEPGKVKALVSGSEVYEVNITITPLTDKEWRGVKARCAGQIGSVVELLQGRLSQGVTAIVTDRQHGLFPRPGEIQMSCSCPDWAGMCKHIAAVMYGIGARLDHQPELFFRLRKVDHLELIEQAVEAVSDAGKKPATTKKTLAQADVANVFGIELAQPEAPPPTEQAAKPTRSKAGKSKPAAKPAPPAPRAASKARRAPKAKKGKQA